MTRLISLPVLIASLLSLPPAGLTHAQEPIRPLLREPTEGSVNNEFVGTITKLTKVSIIIQSRSRREEPPRSFDLSDALAAGKIPMAPRSPPDVNHEYKVDPTFMYRVMDLKAGDWVQIRYARIGGVDICDHICITRRPDGLIPPLPKEAEDLGGDWRKVWKSRTGQRLPEWMEKTPYIPYHERRNAQWAKVAPLPREVKSPSPVRDP